jgi:protein-S-isoprenylcysteine O-methyltransferase Ste14
MKRFALALPGRAKFASAAGTLGFDAGALDARNVSRGASPRPPLSNHASDLAARLLIGALFTLMAMNIGADFLQTGRLTGLLLLASETLVVVFMIFRRSAVIVDRSLTARVLTTLSVMGTPLVRPASVPPIAPELVTVALSACGLLIVIAGKLSLGRSFGLMPANRGIVRTGLYGFVRHPIYLGYLVTHVAFTCAHPTAWNLGLLVAADIALMARAVREELTLAGDPAYREYQQVVRWRVVPGVF